MGSLVPIALLVAIWGIYIVFKKELENSRPPILSGRISDAARTFFDSVFIRFVDIEKVETSDPEMPTFNAVLSSSFTLSREDFTKASKSLVRLFRIQTILSVIHYINRYFIIVSTIIALVGGLIKFALDNSEQVRQTLAVIRMDGLLQSNLSWLKPTCTTLYVASIFYLVLFLCAYIILVVILYNVRPSNAD